MGNVSVLFNRYDLRQSLSAQLEKMQQDVQSYPANDLLNTGLDRLLDYFDGKHRFDVAEIHEDALQFDQSECLVDVRYDQNRFIIDRSQPCLMPGTRYEFFIPFSGDKDTFEYRASTYSYNPPSAEVRGDCVVFVYDRTDHNVEALKANFDSDVRRLKQALEWVAKDAGAWNGTLRQAAQSAIEARRAKLLANQGVASAIGIPLRRRSDGAQTFVAPKVRRKPAIARPWTTSKPFEPEPVLEMVEYEHILTIIRDMVMVIERSPRAFATMHEPGIRDHILVQLNGHYQGQATGETFNRGGKTDVLIRTGGRNIFIAECKFWKGPKSLTNTLDQLLGYATWRDSKLAIVLLHRGQNFTNIVQQVPAILLSHSAVVKQVNFNMESSSRYALRHPDDEDRELLLSVLCFDVPNSAAEAVNAD
jgi:hypothetical protein